MIYTYSITNNIQIIEKREKYEKFKQAPLRSTRAANLRTEASNHKIETDRANQEREKNNLENPIVHDTEKAIKTAIEAIKILIKG